MSGKAATVVEQQRALSRSDGYLPGLDALGMQPHQQGLSWEVAAHCTNVTGRWLNQANRIYVDIQQTSATAFTASCEGGAGWKGATGALTPEGLTLKVGGKPVQHASFGTSAAKRAPKCTEIRFAASNKWCKEPYCTGGGAAGLPGIPHVQSFSEGNGNEHRLSFHGYAKGFAQLIHSPTTWTNNPMIINTNKRLTNDTSPGPIGGPVPRNSLAPEGADYQSILECPCTTKVEKILDGYATRGDGGRCGAATQVESTAECAHAAASAGLLPVVNTSGAGFGCRATLGAEGWSLEVGASPQVGAKGTATAREGVTALAATGVGVRVSLGEANATITLTTGNASAWFGVGFNAKSMLDLPYAIVVEGDGAVSERKLADHAGGTLLPSQVHVVSSTVQGGRRTVVLTRPLTGRAFSFSLTVDTLPLISAVGSGPAFGMHRQHAPGTLSLVRPAAGGGAGGVNVCRDPTSNQGTINGLRFNPSVCAPFPKSELLTTHNAICNISAYGGGLYCCHDKVNLLDKDEPVNAKADVFHMKYRFYFEEHAAQRDAFRVWWSTEATNNEYDVPKSTANCLDASTPKADCTHTIKSVFKGRDFVTSESSADVLPAIERDGGYFNLLYAAFHCHAPACISGELWDNDTGELICRNTAEYGTGTHNEPMNEKGYVIGIPPCVWGSEEEGLAPPPLLHLDSNLTSIKRANSTNGHWGVMALWQSRGAYVNASQAVFRT
jgi:hypothetical protein